VPARDLDWPDCVNVRDLGGLRTAAGVVVARRAVVRADNVERLTEAGWELARRYGVTTVLDLRSGGERADARSVPPGLDDVTVSLFDDFDSDPDYRTDVGRRIEGAEAVEAYRLLYAEALERNRAETAAAVRAVANARPGAVLVHCVGGKDRTGVLAALLLRLVDVPVATVAEDYGRSEARLGLADSAPASVIDVVLERLEGEYGSVAAYLASAGLSESELGAVRARLLAA